MASNSSCPELPPNPNYPLALLEPQLATQFDISRYLYAISLGIYIWDIFINLPADYKLLFKCKLGITTFIYYLSRVATFCYIATSFAFQVAPVEHCQALQIALGVCLVVTISSTSLLFYLRLRAVFFMEKSIQVVFGILWLAVIGSSITVPVGISGTHIGPTLYCINSRVENYTVATAIVPLINDSAVFFAITYRVLSYHMVEDTFGARVKAFVGGGSIPKISRALLVSGQYYYLIAVCGNILLVIMSQTKSLPPVYHAMCTIPVLAVINLLACTVFRKVKFGHITGDGTVHNKSRPMDVRSAQFRPGMKGSGRDMGKPGRGHGYMVDGSDTVTYPGYPMSNISKTAIGPDGAGAVEVAIMKESITSVHDSV